jgi:GWxTD domain-containing protein
MTLKSSKIKLTGMKSVFILFTLFLLFSCDSTRRAGNRNLAYLYSPGINFLNPDYAICNINGDTSRLFFRLKASELLFTRSDTIGNFKSSFIINYALLQGYDSKFASDTGSHYFEFNQSSDSDAVIFDHIDIHAKDSLDYLLQVTMTDLNRKEAVTSYKKIDKTGIQPHNDFIAIDNNSGKPILTNYIGYPASVKLFAPGTNRNRIYLRFFSRNFPIAAPPFSSGSFRPLSYFSDEMMEINLDTKEPIVMDKEGIYHFQYDSLVREGYTLIRYEDDYPKITRAENLLESIRYLTTRQEYDKLFASSNKKEAVDNYWLALAGNKERARVLIRNYYSRVQFANRMFTSYLEGWKSDRGMIYIIFGPPSSIYRSDESEVWNYNQLFNYNSFSFTFDRLSNPFTDNDYRLRRSAYYEIPWYRAVDSWRDGRVVNDSY